MELTFELLKRMVGSTDAGIRVRQRLQPLGGEGDKIFPPTYSGKAGPTYILETRRADGADIECCVLDSVQSQANRLESALNSARDAGRIDFPVLTTRFDDPELLHLGTINSIQASHRISDAIFRDSVEEGSDVFFRDTPKGKAFDRASPRNATAILSLCPSSLVFGTWNSTTLVGRLGDKFQRIIASEIVAYNAKRGVTSGVRGDLLEMSSAVELYCAKNGEPGHWTPDTELAETQTNGNPKPFSKKGKATAKKAAPSSIGYSNIPQAVNDDTGGITCDFAERRLTISFPGVRRLNFTETIGGQPIENQQEVKLAAHTALIAIAVASVILQDDYGHDLRSRCALVSESELKLERVLASGATETLTLNSDAACEILNQAGVHLRSFGIEWERDPMQLKAAKNLVHLKKRSDTIAGQASDEEI